MPSRRDFLRATPVAAAGLLSACDSALGRSGATIGGAASPGTTGGLPPATAAARPAPRPLLAAVPADAAVLNWIPKHDELAYTFGGVPARQRIRSGTKIVSWAEDCFDGAVKKPGDMPSKVMLPAHDNPQTGPFHLEGAEPGDTVAVHILSLSPARDHGISSFFPGFGAIVGTDRTAMLAPDLPETVWWYEVDVARNTARTRAQQGGLAWEVPLAPFLGCLGVAPAMNEARSTIVPGPFGGNMDCWEVRAGNTVFLGVNLPGAMLSFGDGHYTMGEGEIIGTAVEGAMNVELYVELIKGSATPVPRIENADEVMFVGSGRPLEDATRMAFKAMVGWVRKQAGLGEMDAFQFVSQNSRASVVQLVDPEYTVLVSLDKHRLPA